MSTYRQKRRPSGSLNIRISRIVESHLNKHKHGYKQESFDACLRRLFGLPDKKGNAQPLRTYWIVPNGTEPKAFLTSADARGHAIVLATKKGHKKADTVIAVREEAS